MKILDTAEYLSVLRQLTEEGQEVSVTITGSSMTPFLVHERDRVVFKKPDRPLKKGDIVFYQRDNGQYIMHRIVKVRAGSDVASYEMAGDSQSEIEKGIREDQIFGLVTKICRKGKWIEPGDFWWEFFEKVWINLISARHTIRVAYGKIMKRD